MFEEYSKIINEAWENRDNLSNPEVRKTIEDTIALLDQGRIRAAEKINDEWVVNQWVKKAVIMYFPIRKMETIE